MVVNRTAAKTARSARTSPAGSKKTAPARKKATKSAQPAAADKPATKTRKAAAGRSAAKKAAPKKAAATKGTVKKAAAKKTAPKKAAAKKTAPKKAAAKKTSSPRKTTAPPKKTAPAKKAVPAEQRPAAREPAAEPVAREPVAGKAARKPTTRKSAGASQSRTRTGAKTVVAKKTASGARGRTGTAGGASLPAARAAAEQAGIVGPGELAVRPGEEPWSEQEVAGARAELKDEGARLRDEIRVSEEAVSGLMRDSGDGAGDDQADVGTKNISREHEMSLADNAREMLTQTEHALERLDNGTYGLCESCGKAIGKARMQAFPRATLCVECKQRSERR